MSSWNVTFWLSFQNTKTCFIFVIGMLHFSRFLFLINFQWLMHSICVWNVIKQSKSLQTRYNRTFIYIYDRYYTRTHIYMCSFLVWKKRVFELSRVWPWRWPCGGTPYMVFIGPVYHYTIRTYLKRVGHCGYEWAEKEMGRFVEDMS